MKEKGKRTHTCRMEAHVWTKPTKFEYVSGKNGGGCGGSDDSSFNARGYRKRKSRQQDLNKTVHSDLWMKATWPADCAEFSSGLTATVYGGTATEILKMKIEIKNEKNENSSYCKTPAGLINFFSSTHKWINSKIFKAIFKQSINHKPKLKTILFCFRFFSFFRHRHRLPRVCSLYFICGVLASSLGILISVPVSAVGAGVQKPRAPMATSSSVAIPWSDEVFTRRRGDPTDESVRRRRDPVVDSVLRWVRKRIHAVARRIRKSGVHTRRRRNLLQRFRRRKNGSDFKRMQQRRRSTIVFLNDVGQIFVGSNRNQGFQVSSW